MPYVLKEYFCYMGQLTSLLSHLARVLRWLNYYYQYPYCRFHQDSQHSFKYTDSYPDSDNRHNKRCYTPALQVSGGFTGSGTS